MRKTIYLLTLLFFVSLANASEQDTIPSKPDTVTTCTHSHMEAFLPKPVVHKDTTYTMDHPNAQDSVLFVNVINGIVTIIPKVRDNPLLHYLGTNPAIVGGFITFVFGVWRSVELRIRKLRKKDLVKDKPENKDDE